MNLLLQKTGLENCREINESLTYWILLSSFGLQFIQGRFSSIERCALRGAFSISRGVFPKIDTEWFHRLLLLRHNPPNGIARLHRGYLS